MAPMRISFIHSVIASSMLCIGSYPRFLAEQPGKQGYKCHADQRNAAARHELAHIRGYIYEDEANFIAFLACVESDDSTFQYAGYLSVLNYVANDLYKTRLADPDSYAAAREAVHPLQVLQQVQEDNIFVTEEQWERINGKAVVNTETVDSVSDTLTNASLKLNGVSDGMISYNRVVELLLQWYGEKEEF